MRAILIVAVSVLALTGCSNSVAIREAVGQGTRQLQGAELVLGSPLPIAAGKARVFLQDGIVSAGDGASSVAVTISTGHIAHSRSGR